MLIFEFSFGDDFVAMIDVGALVGRERARIFAHFSKRSTRSIGSVICVDAGCAVQQRRLVYYGLCPGQRSASFAAHAAEALTVHIRKYIRQMSESRTKYNPRA